MSESTRLQKLIERNTKHGLHGHPLYARWKNMKSRCLIKGTPCFHRYGGRGISICQQWADDFFSFYLWAMSNGWRNDLQLDRIDNNGHYDPSNCRFVTKTENCRNRQSSKLTADQVKEILTSTESRSILAKRYGIGVSMVGHIKRGETWTDMTRG